jgi:D-alanyl-D-alanine carboxypeptidase/D-alanyl-D-alanine-endopeptidase (penicillin-binding protein 4)
VQAAGVSAVTGSIVGSTGYFARDWNAPGWKPNFPEEEVPRPSALAFEGNVAGENHIKNPEWRAARSMTRRLEAIGIQVGGSARAAVPVGGLEPVANVESVPMQQMLRFMNRQSSNFFAEMYLKRLAVETYGAPGSLAAGARSLETWAARRDVTLTAHDGSGLSYSNRVTPGGMTRLLSYSEKQPWGVALRNTLAGAGQGTLEERLAGVKLRAKTGTLDYISTLSGYVWLRQTRSWGEFSIMSSGMLKTTAAGMEDEIVRELTRSAQP